MGIILYDYSQRVYAAAVAMMEEEWRAATIYPTGTGKSFIAFRLAEEHPDSRICWLAPGEYIFTTQSENLKRTLPDCDTASFPNIRFLSYSRLMRNEEYMNEQEWFHLIDTAPHIHCLLQQPGDGQGFCSL